jgi:hypothetical protein
MTTLLNRPDSVIRSSRYSRYSSSISPKRAESRSSRRAESRSSSSISPKRTTGQQRSLVQMRSLPKKKAVEIFESKNARVIPELTREYGKFVDQYFEEDNNNKPVVIFKKKSVIKTKKKLRLFPLYKTKTNKFSHEVRVYLDKYGKILVDRPELTIPDSKYSTFFPKKMTNGDADKVLDNIKKKANMSGSIKETQINWVRHGVSCANITSLFTKAYKTVGDTPLFESSTLGACYLNTYNRGTGDENEQRFTRPLAYNAGFVFCSQMLRAIQTAILMFPDKFLEGKMRVVTGINEHGITSGNKPQHWKNTLSDLIYWYDHMRVELKKLPKPNDFCEKTFEKFDVKFNDCALKIFDLFDKGEIKQYKSKSMPEDIVVPDIIDYLYLPSVYKDTNGNMLDGFIQEGKGTSFSSLKIPKNITIVSHSNYIKNNIMSTTFLKKLTNTTKMPSKDDGKLYNNGIYIKLYKMKTYYTGTHVLKPGEIESKSNENVLNQGCLHNKKTKKINCFKNLQDYDAAKSKDDSELEMSISLKSSKQTCDKKMNYIVPNIFVKKSTKKRRPKGRRRRPSKASKKDKAAKAAKAAKK